ALRVRAEASSQFLSALLMIAPIAVPDTGNFAIEVDGPLVSEPYVNMTIEMAAHWGLMVERSGNRFLTRHAGAHGTFHEQGGYSVEPDASAASYFFAAAAITGGTVTVLGLSRKNSLQGDLRFVDLLEQMGCRVEECSSGITVHGRPL